MTGLPAREATRSARYTWTDVFDQPEQMLAELRELLQPSTSPRRIA